MKQRWIAVCLFALFVAFSLGAYARVGGGHSYSGGGSSSHGSSSSSSHSSSGSSYRGGSSGSGSPASCGCSLLFFLMFIVILVVVANSAARRQTPSAVYRATGRPSTLALLRDFDPNFSRAVFEDFCYSLFARVHHARGSGDLARYAPYLS